MKPTQKKTVTDTRNRYHNIPLYEEDRHVATFITSWGHYWYKVATQGFFASVIATPRDLIQSTWTPRKICVPITRSLWIPWNSNCSIHSGIFWFNRSHWKYQTKPNILDLNPTPPNFKRYIRCKSLVRSNQSCSICIWMTLFRNILKPSTHSIGLKG